MSNLWLQTFTGKQVFPMDMKLDDIDLVDIAHSLSRQCRYNGHSRVFYSVAEHSTLLARHAMQRKLPLHIAKIMLLHDASEAYISDICRPLKKQLPQIKPIEQIADKLVCEKFGLIWPWPEIVHEWDQRITMDERMMLMRVHPDWECWEPLGVKIQMWSPERAELEFFHAYNDLWGGPYVPTQSA